MGDNDSKANSYRGRTYYNSGPLSNLQSDSDSSIGTNSNTASNGRADSDTSHGTSRSPSFHPNERNPQDLILFNAPPWRANVTTHGTAAKAVDDRCREINGNWRCIRNREVEDKISANFERPLPIQERIIAAFKENADVFMRAPSGYGRTNAWMIPLIDRVMERKGNPGVLRNIIVAHCIDIASHFGSQMNLLIPHNQRGKKLFPTTWFWYDNERESACREIKEYGSAVLITTYTHLMSLMQNPPFNPALVETIVLDEFCSVESTYWKGIQHWTTNVKEHLGKDTQTILVGRTGWHTDAKNFMRDWNVTIEAAQVLDNPAPKRDFICAIGTWEEECELHRAIDQLNKELSNNAIVIWFDNNAEADAVYNLLREKGWNRLCKLTAITDNRDGWGKDLLCFRERRFDILLCSSWFAERVIDIPGQSDIFMGMPRNFEQFKLRLTRNGRVRTGRSITILKENEIESAIPLIEQMLLEVKANMDQLNQIKKDSIERKKKIDRIYEVDEDMRRLEEEIERLKRGRKEREDELNVFDNGRREKNSRAYDE